jgi:hypothetical protein
MTLSLKFRKSDTVHPAWAMVRCTFSGFWGETNFAESDFLKLKKKAQFSSKNAVMFEHLGHFQKLRKVKRYIPGPKVIGWAPRA